MRLFLTIQPKRLSEHLSIVGAPKQIVGRYLKKITEFNDCLNGRLSVAIFIMRVCH